MKLSKEFFSVCQRAIKNATWKYEEFPLVQSVEQELKNLYNAQRQEPNQPNQTEPKQPTPEPETKPNDELDQIIKAGVEQAKNAKSLEDRLLKNVVVEPLPDNQADY